MKIPPYKLTYRRPANVREATKVFLSGGIEVSGSNVFCPRPGCEKELVWQNDYDLGLEDDDGTYTDLACVCGVMVTIPWEREDEDN